MLGVRTSRNLRFVDAFDVELADVFAAGAFKAGLANRIVLHNDFVRSRR